MKKLSLIFLFSIFAMFLNAQSDVYLKVKKAIQENYPEISLENKLIAINNWSSNNQESREANKEFNRIYKIYEFAKLKGGLKGLVCVSINNEGDAASIILNKDGASKLLQLNKIEISTPNSNVVFDDKGNEVYKNISSDKIFESINKLITR
ncbi:MAG: hypothetical protein Q7W45_09765 [Bacteroidota bacterium]|nr:hypothetical protein [Bacteroidota bacterium]MDP3143759.1 hypothetical protein [Bacteroidota bacterium]